MEVRIKADNIYMRLLLAIFLLLIQLNHCWAVELFGVPLASADKGNLGLAARAAGAKLQDSGQPEVFEVFDSTEALKESFRLFLGFDAQDNQFAFAEYHIYPMSHRHMLAKLKRKYGEPQEQKGKFISDQHYSWRQNGIEISYQRQWGCKCSELRYSKADKVEVIKRQHAQVQKQRLDERLDEQRARY